MCTCVSKRQVTVFNLSIFDQVLKTLNFEIKKHKEVWNLKVIFILVASEA